LGECQQKKAGEKLCGFDGESGPGKKEIPNKKLLGGGIGVVIELGRRQRAGSGNGWRRSELRAG